MGFQEIFKKIYENHDGQVYLKDVVLYLRAANEDVDSNIKVC